jgi:hypothetical protein
MLRCVDVYAVMKNGSRRLSFTGSVRTMIDRHWLYSKMKPKEDLVIDDLLDGMELTLPLIFPDREKIDSNQRFRLFFPTPIKYVAIGREA